MNFNIIDGNDDIDYDSILEDYQNLDLTVREIKEKHGISDGRWQTITRHWREQGIPLRGRMNRKKHRYIATPFASKNYTYDKRNGVYKVYKKIEGKTYLFGSYGTEEEAKQRVEELKKNKWNGLLK